MSRKQQYLVMLRGMLTDNIRGGITIGKGSVVGAGSVVTRVSVEIARFRLKLNPD